MRAALPAAAGSSLRAGLAHHAAQVGLADRRLARLVLLGLLGELLLLGLLGGALALGLDRLASARLASSRFASSRLRSSAWRAASTRSASSRRACSRAARSIAICASTRGGGAGSGLATGGAGFGSTTGGAGFGSGGVGRGAAVCGSADQSSATTPSGSLAFQLTLKVEGDDQEDMREDRQREPRAHAGRLLRREHVALEDGGVHRLSRRRASHPPRWLLTDRPTRWTPARCSASITLTTDS